MIEGLVAFLTSSLVEIVSAGFTAAYRIWRRRDEGEGLCMGLPALIEQ